MQWVEKLIFVIIALLMVSNGIQAYAMHTSIKKISDQGFMMRPGQFVPWNWREDRAWQRGDPSPAPNPLLYAGTCSSQQCQERAHDFIQKGEAVGGYNYRPNVQSCEIYSQVGINANTARFVPNMGLKQNDPRYSLGYSLTGLDFTK